MSFAVFVHLPGEKPATNAVRFATEDEAQRAGSELLDRWFAPSGFEVRAMEELVNYEFPIGASRPQHIEGTP